MGTECERNGTFGKIIWEFVAIAMQHAANNRLNLVAFPDIGKSILLFDE